MFFLTQILNCQLNKKKAIYSINMNYMRSLSIRMLYCMVIIIKKFFIDVYIPKLPIYC